MTGRCFYTDDVVQPTSTPGPVDPSGEPDVFLPEREGPAPPVLAGVPTLRLRCKTAVPAIRSMLHIEGGHGVMVMFPTVFWTLSNLLHGGSLHYNGFEIPGYLQSHFEMDDVD